MPTFHIGRTAGEGRRSPAGKPLPSYASFLRSLDAYLAAQSLTPKSQRLAKAFAIAAYRRTLARRTDEAVGALVGEAIANAFPSSSAPAAAALEGESHFHHIGYAIGSRRARRQKSRKPGITAS